MTKAFVVSRPELVTPDKTALILPATTADQARVGDRWLAVKKLKHGDAVQAVNHVGLQTTTAGDLLDLQNIDGHSYAIVRVARIAFVEGEKISNTELHAIGYTDHAAYEADWGRLLRGGLWLFEVEHLAQDEMPSARPGYITVEEMAAMHQVDPHTIRRALWADEERQPEDQRIPGAIKVGGDRRGVWEIPLQSAKAFRRSASGRQRSS